MDAEVAGRILDHALQAGPRCGSVILIVIDGRSGAGKTTLAAQVATLVQTRGLVATVLHTDELCPGWNGLPDIPNRILRLLEQLAETGEASYPTWDWVAGSAGPNRAVTHADVLIIEGAAAADPLWLDLASASVLVHAPAALRRRRAIARDGDNFAKHWEHWAQSEDRYFGARLPWRADIVVDCN